MRVSMWRVAAPALIMLAVLSKAEMPEDDFRIISKKDLLASDSDIFGDTDGGGAYAQLLFDVARDQVVVGARDALYRLSLHGLRMLEKAEWPAPADKAQLCQDKGQTERDCRNYVKVLLSYGHKLFACGTNAFSPVCSWREIESIGRVLEWSSGAANCPYNPRSNVTGLMSNTGEYYAGTPTDFASSYTTILRSKGAFSLEVSTLSTTPHDRKWLNEPQFVGSFEDDSFVYFVYREVAVEFLNCGKATYSRIARVCKNDVGSPFNKENWSTFLKARLNCSTKGEFPFYYDEVQSVEYLTHEKLLVATFTTPDNAIAGSAVCIYNMSDITEAFDGPFRVQDHPSNAWEPRPRNQQNMDHFRCRADSGLNMQYRTYYLMSDAVQPISHQPVYTSTLERFTHVTMDVTHTKSVGKQFVVFVATLKRQVAKLVVLPAFAGACLVELWRLADESGGFDVRTMQFVKDTMSVYLGTDQGVVRLGAHRCERYLANTTCLATADPYCGWDEGRELCVDATTHLYDASFTQATDKCASMDTAVDGSWSAWSSWQPCEQDTAQPLPYGEEKPDMCQCRTRRCDNPSPANGGKGCTGTTVSVTNCTVHGGWSPWSGWSECSASCGIAIKSKRRACTAPEPKFGGRVCVGLDSQELFCTNLPPCPDPSLAPVDGGWSAWSAWSACSGSGCGAGAGARERRRACTAPAPARGGADCEGGRVERAACDLRQCELSRAAAWTPWLNVPSNASDGSYIERRFKFLCRARTSEQIKVSISKEEDRYCSPTGVCSTTPPDSAWESWAPWEACSAPCGGGTQTRRRACRERGACEGAADMLRACNTHACTDEWSCWSEWSPCVGACEAAGVRTRTRACLSPEGCARADSATERRVCVNTCGDSEAGWGAWGQWSSCSSGGRIRRRACERGACAGNSVQVATCGDDDTDNELSPSPEYGEVERAAFVTLGGGDALGVGGVVVCVVAAFVAGCLLTLAAVTWVRRRRGRPPWRGWRGAARVPSSPHYIAAKQNSYVTVPLKDVPRKAKRQPSFTGIGGGSGVILKSNNLSNNTNHHNNTLATPKLYPKAIANEYDTLGTLRRHSNLPNNRNNLEEEEKFY